MQSRVELTITTFGTLLIAGAEAHDYSLVQEVSPASLAPAQKEKSHGMGVVRPWQLVRGLHSHLACENLVQSQPMSITIASMFLSDARTHNTA